MDIAVPLFEGEHIRLAPIDHEKDAEIEAKWTHDAEFLRMLNAEPLRPLAPFQVKKKYEALEKEADEGRSLFYFTIRARPDDRLLGFARILWVEWNNGNGFIQLGIGEASERGKGYGTEALALLLRFAFAEINLYRLSAIVPEYNQIALHMLQQVGFVEEVRRRQALHRDGRTWDLIHLGLLRKEWRR